MYSRGICWRGGLCRSRQPLHADLAIGAERERRRMRCAGVFDRSPFGGSHHGSCNPRWALRLRCGRCGSRFRRAPRLTRRAGDLAPVEQRAAPARRSQLADVARWRSRPARWDRIDVVATRSAGGDSCRLRRRGYPARLRSASIERRRSTSMLVTWALRQCTVGCQLRQLSRARALSARAGASASAFALPAGLASARRAARSDREHRDPVALMHRRRFLDWDLDHATGGLGTSPPGQPRFARAARWCAAASTWSRDLDADDLARLGCQVPTSISWGQSIDAVAGLVGICAPRRSPWSRTRRFTRLNSIRKPTVRGQHSNRSGNPI